MSADATLWRGSIQKLFEVRFWPKADIGCKNKSVPPPESHLPAHQCLHQTSVGPCANDV